MIDTQLIIVEGVMGSGKSTTSLHITRRLRQNKRSAKHVPESFRSHPTSVTRTLTHWCKIWIEHTPESFIAQSQCFWRAFVEEARQTSTIYIFDGQFFHGDLTGLFIANTPPAQLFAYVDSLVEIIQPLQPSFVYLYQEDVARSLERVAAERGKSWLRRQLEWKTESPYCVERGYAGIAGWLQLYRDYRTLTNELYVCLPMPKIAVENSAGQWDAVEAQICAFLGLLN
jgi:hypothetical protein